METSTTGLRFPKARALRWELPIVVLAGWLLAVVSAAQTPTTYEVLHAFRNTGKPMSSLVQVGDGSFYGTTYFGGTSGVGTVFKVDPSGSVTTVHSFAYADGAFPTAGLIYATDGYFYGTTTAGGTSNRGIVYRMDVSGNVTTLHSLDGTDGATPQAALIQASDGEFYGTTSDGGGTGHIGIVFRIGADGVFVVLYRFSITDGFGPYASLVQASDGNFYGTTAGGGTYGHGTVFKIDAAGELTTLHHFKSISDGADPYSALIQASDGNFYGTTRSGGASEGTIYRMTADGEVTVLHSFMLNDGLDPYAPLVEATDGNFYGATGIGTLQSTIFKMGPSGDFSILHSFGYDAADPYGGLIQATDGNLYGTASAGGENARGIGSVYRIDLQGNFETIHAFESTELVGPQYAPIQGPDGNLYGAVGGGEFGSGVIYRMDPFGNLGTIHTFTGIDGAGPAALSLGTDGSFYGTTSTGGQGGWGTVFEMLLSGEFNTLHSFSGSDGEGPAPALIQGSDGAFYGTTSYGGSGESGTVFRIAPPNDLTTLKNLQYPDGEFPSAGLIQAEDGDYYGTTQSSIFKTSSSGDFSKLFDFYDGGYGFGSKSGLIQLAAGTFYGTTSSGGDSNQGTLYTMDPSGAVTTLHSFSGPDGTYPQAALVQASDGYLYGTTLVGGQLSPGCPGSGGCGTIYRVDSSGDFHLVHSFNILDGRWPVAALNRIADDRLYGTASGGGPFGGQGVIFRLSDAQVTVNEVSPSSGSPTGGVALIVLGGGFVPGTTITVSGIDATNVTVADPTYLYLVMPALSPGTLNDVAAIAPQSFGTASATHPQAFFADFLDVPQTYSFHDFIERIFRAGITAGCGGGSYCPDDGVTRAQMAVFLLKAEHGANFVPPACGSIFGDVPCPSVFADWIEQLAAEGITAGCGGGNYCPAAPVTRAQMAVFLLKAEHGSTYIPPSCTSVFQDVPCPGQFTSWIERLYAEHVTGGCSTSPLLYCPTNANTRGQMAVFLAKTFNLQ